MQTNTNYSRKKSFYFNVFNERYFQKKYYISSGNIYPQVLRISKGKNANLHASEGQSCVWATVHLHQIVPKLLEAIKNHKKVKTYQSCLQNFKTPPRLWSWQQKPSPQLTWGKIHLPKNRITKLTIQIEKKQLYHYPMSRQPVGIRQLSYSQHDRLVKNWAQFISNDAIKNVYH